MQPRSRESGEPPGGNIALAVVGAAWLVVLGLYLAHRIVLSSDSMNNYVHVWAIARDLWHHGRLPWRLPVLGHGDAYAYPYGVVNWTTAAIVWPLFGNWGVTLWTALGAVACAAATFVAFPELARGWWAAAVLANPVIVESMLFGQQTFAWAATLLLLGVACWRRGHPLAAAVLVGVGQATHAAVVGPIGLLLVAAWLPFERDRRRLLAWYAVSVAIAAPAVLLVFASPGYADATARDRVVNFLTTVGPRLLVVALPILFVLARRTRIAALAPLALVVALAVNVAFEEPLNVGFQWKALRRTSDTASLDAFLRSPRFEPGATYRVLRGAGDAKLGMYHVLLAGGRLDSEMFPESMAIRDFHGTGDYERLLCDRHVDFVIAYTSYTASRRTNELAVLARLARLDRLDGRGREPGTGPRASVRAVERGAGHTVYAVDRRRCAAGAGAARAAHPLTTRVRQTP